MTITSPPIARTLPAAEELADKLQQVFKRTDARRLRAVEAPVTPQIRASEVLPREIVQLPCGCIGQRAVIHTEVKPQFFIKAACDDHRSGRIQAVEPDADVGVGS